MPDCKSESAKYLLMWPGQGTVRVANTNLKLFGFVCKSEPTATTQTRRRMEGVLNKFVIITLTLLAPGFFGCCRTEEGVFHPPPP